MDLDASVATHLHYVAYTYINGHIRNGCFWMVWVDHHRTFCVLVCVLVLFRTPYAQGLTSAAVGSEAGLWKYACEH